MRPKANWTSLLDRNPSDSVVITITMNKTTSKAAPGLFMFFLLSRIANLKLIIDRDSGIVSYKALVIVEPNKIPIVVKQVFRITSQGGMYFISSNNLIFSLTERNMNRSCP